MPDRGDRGELTEFVIGRLPKEIPLIHVNYPPQRRTFDLTGRVKHGVDMAKSRGYKKVFIVENDDYYPKEYFQPFNYDFIGYSDSIYYHLSNRTWDSFIHPGRSSLFTTAFSISAIEHFRWPSDNIVFLDLELWHHARMRRKTISLRPENPCIGIKHGIGLCGGKGHKQTFKNMDMYLEWLEKHVDSEAFQFYSKMIAKLNRMT